MSMIMLIYPGDAWCLLVVRLLIYVTVVILSAWLLARLGNRWNAARRYSIYLVALICVLASPVLSLLMEMGGSSLLALRPSVPTVASAEPASVLITHGPESSLVEANLVRQDAEGLGQGPQFENPAALSFLDTFRTLAAAVLVTWLMGVAVLLARWCHWLRLIAALRRTAQPLDYESLNCETISEPLRLARRALGTDKLPLITVSADLDQPVMVGLIHPQVILPRHVLQTLDGRGLADILVHECAHAICRHHVVGLLQRVAIMLFWPHPLIYLLNRELARAREEVCDNYVLRHSEAPRYGQTLLKLSQTLQGVSPKPVALGLFFHCPWRLEDRVADLLNRRRNKMIRVSRWTTAALAAAFLLPSLLVASTRVLQAQPAGREKVTPTAALPGSPDRSSLGETDALTQDGELRQSARNLREIMSAIHTYHDVAGHFPMAKSGWGYDEKTKEWFRQRPYLSWRVLLLPLLGEKKLFERFRMGEPWNSEHNRKLIPLIPTIYRAPGSKTVEGRTNYLGAVGPNAAFPNKSAIMVPDFTDGTSNTIMLVEVPDTAAVEWTRPKDFPADTDGPVTKLVGLRKGGFLTAFADGAPQFISDSIAPETLRWLLHRNDGLLIGAPESIHFVRPATAPAVNAE